MEHRAEDDYDQRQSRLRADLLKLKIDARTLPLHEWVDRAFGIIEREKVQELERYKIKQHAADLSPRTLMGGRIVEVREDR